METAPDESQETGRVSRGADRCGPDTIPSTLRDKYPRDYMGLPQRLRFGAFQRDPAQPVHGPASLGAVRGPGLCDG